MNNLNSILIEGNLTRDPILEKTEKGTAVCTFCVACKRHFKQEDEYEEEVSYFDVRVFGRTAESCHEYLGKGRGVRVVGRLFQEKWIEENDEQQQRVIIIGEHIEFKPITKKPDSESVQTAGSRTKA